MKKNFVQNAVMKFNGFSDFFRNASIEEKKELFLSVAQKANENQRRIMKRYNKIIDNINNTSMKILSEEEERALLGSYKLPDKMQKVVDGYNKAFKSPQRSAEQKNLDLLGSFNHKPSQQFLEFRKIIEDMYDMHMRKNNDYGSDSINLLGLKGLFVRMHDKICRLKTLLWDGKEQSVNDESIEDTLIDLANYAVIALIFKNGKWGK